MSKMISLLLFSAAAVSVAAAGPVFAAPPLSPMRLDVAGVRLGMPRDEAQAAARKAGYKCADEAAVVSAADKVAPKNSKAAF